MRRVGKLMYEWVGFDHLPGLLEQLAQDEANGALGWVVGLCRFSQVYSTHRWRAAAQCGPAGAGGPGQGQRLGWCLTPAKGGVNHTHPPPSSPPPLHTGVQVEDRIRRAPTVIIVNEQGEEVGSGKGNSHSLWVLSRRLVRMLLKQEGPIALTAAASVLVGPGGVSDPSKHRSQTQVRLG